MTSYKDYDNDKLLQVYLEEKALYDEFVPKGVNHLLSEKMRRERQEDYDRLSERVKQLQAELLVRGLLMKAPEQYMREVPFEIEKLKHTSRTVSGVVQVMRLCWHYDVYEISTGMLILVQSNEHGMVEPIFVSIHHWHAITCLMWSVHCGSGES